MTAANPVRPAAFGLAGAALMAIGSLVASPAGATGAEVWTKGLALLADAHEVRIMIGAALAPLGAALALAGCIAVFRLLRPAGRGVALVAAAGFAQFFVCLAAYEAGRPIIGALHRVPELAPDASLIVDATTYLNVHRALAGLGLFFGSMFYFFTVLFRDTLLPRLAVVATPVIWVPLIRITPLLPAGGGAFWFAFLDVVWIGVFAALFVWARRAPAGPTEP